ncbi:histidinol-phosphatase [Aureimonas mangrovi]|uniref:histidinol-phosphatase n=1 Tax=Aureimonas mangrovi TaxID=2758041 RepID=UPI00163D7FEE|nr:histidinol-phosphatase [Aureimonas mangrovi]
MTEEPDAEFLFALCDAAAAQTLPRFRTGTDVDNKIKGAFDPVTEADRAAERAVIERIQARYPDHAILGEEYGARGEGRLRWVIDPIDGTRSFISGIPLWGTLIGFTVDGHARAGIMSQPYIGERFWADASGAYCDGPGGRRPMTTRDTQDLDEAILFTTAPELMGGDLADRFSALSSAVRLTRYGADCYAFALLAAGQVDLCVETGLQPYDIVALIPMIEKAGGVITTWDGGRAEEGGSVLAAATPELHERALRVFNG